MVSNSREQNEIFYQNRTPDVVVDTYETNTVTKVWSEVSIAAIFCGVVTALIVQFAMNMLGLSIGVNTINPATEINPIEPALGPAAVIWIAASTLLALFVGGWVAGRLSNTRNHTNSVLHGVITSAVTAIILLAVVGSAVGGLVSGVGRAISQGATILTSSTLDTVPIVADSLGLQDGTLQSITGELRSALNDVQATGTSEETVDGRPVAAQPQVDNDAPLSLADLELSRNITQFVTNPEVDETVRQDLAAQMAARTSLSEADAAAQLETWRNSYQQVLVQVEDTARDVGQAISDTVAAVSGMIFAVLFIGTAAAGLGAYLAVSKYESLPVHAYPTTSTVVKD